MDSHRVGRRRGTRQGGIFAVQSFPITFNNRVSGQDYLIARYDAKLKSPSRLRIVSIVETPDNGTTSVLRLGFTPGSTVIHNDVDLKAAANTNYTDAGGAMRIIGSVVELWARVTRTGAPTAGRAWVTVEEVGLDVTKELPPA